MSDQPQRPARCGRREGTARSRILLLALTLSGPLGAEPAAPDVSFRHGEAISAPEGWVVLEWSPAGAAPGWRPGEGIEFVLQQAVDGGFADAQVRYQGPDTASFVSGLSEGGHLFRVRSRTEEADGRWSAVQRVEVEYVSHRQVFLLMGMGAVVFLATVTAITMGHRRSVREASEGAGISHESG